MVTLPMTLDGGGMKKTRKKVRKISGLEVALVLQQMFRLSQLKYYTLVQFFGSVNLN